MSGNEVHRLQGPSGDKHWQVGSRGAHDRTEGHSHAQNEQAPAAENIARYFTSAIRASVPPPVLLAAVAARAIAPSAPDERAPHALTAAISGIGNIN